MRFADSADDNGKLGGGTEKYKTKIVINSSGYCNWMAPAIFQSSCDVNTEYFPFDDQVSQAIKNLSWILVIKVFNMRYERNTSPNCITSKEDMREKRKCEKTTKTKNKNKKKNECSQRRQEAGGLEPRRILQRSLNMLKGDLTSEFG